MNDFQNTTEYTYRCKIYIIYHYYYYYTIVAMVGDTCEGVKSVDAQQLPLVGESILKKRHDLDDLVRKRAALEEIEPKRRGRRKVVASGGTTSTSSNSGSNKKDQPRSVQKTKTKFYVMKPETIYAHVRNQRNQQRRLSRVQKKGMQSRASSHPTMATKRIPPTNDEDLNDVTTELLGEGDTTNSATNINATRTRTHDEISYQTNSVGANMVFVIRIRDSVATPKAIINILVNKLHLRNVNDGVFVRFNNESMRRLLHMVEPYILYGPIKEKSMVHDLLIRRGYAKINNNERVPLSNNMLIEQEFQKEKYKEQCNHVLCIEDMVHEIFSVGVAFDVITKEFLFPFQLSNSKTEYEKRTLQVKEFQGTIHEKEYGDRGHRIHEYIQQVL
jgi:60S ribosomal protein uL30